MISNRPRLVEAHRFFRVFVGTLALFQHVSGNRECLGVGVEGKVFEDAEGSFQFPSVVSLKTGLEPGGAGEDGIGHTQ